MLGRKPAGRMATTAVELNALLTPTYAVHCSLIPKRYITSKTVSASVAFDASGVACPASARMDDAYLALNSNAWSPRMMDNWALP